MMEKAVTTNGESEGLDARFPIMRALARYHECDADTLCGRVDASEVDVHDILGEMVSRAEVEALPNHLSGSRGERFTLTSKGWVEYLKVLGSIYELPE